MASARLDSEDAEDQGVGSYLLELAVEGADLRERVHRRLAASLEVPRLIERHRDGRVRGKGLVRLNEMERRAAR